MCSFLFFFFKQKTADVVRISDWSSDVYASDLGRASPARSPAAAADGASVSKRSARGDSFNCAMTSAVRPAAATRPLERTIRLVARDRKSVGEGTRGSVRVDAGGRRNITKQQSSTTSTRAATC